MEEKEQFIDFRAKITEMINTSQINNFLKEKEPNNKDLAKTIEEIIELLTKKMQN